MREERVRNRGRGLFPESADPNEGIGKGTLETSARLYPSIIDFRVFRIGRQQNYSVEAGAHNVEGQANRGDKALLSRIMMVGGEEAYDRIASQAGNPQKTVDNCYRSALVRRLNHHL